jgi:dihydropteroate synthase
MARSPSLGQWGDDAPQVMGVLNVTPDSFSDGGRFFSLDAAIEQAARMRDEGASIIDVGGESTRPGSGGVDEDEELARVIPVIESIRSELRLPVSIDTSKPSVMQAAVRAGACMINDVRGLREEGALAAASELGVAVCLMHMQGDPRTMQDAPHYEDVVEEVAGFLEQRAAACEEQGIARARIFVDPGIGFGKTLEHNLLLMANLDALVARGRPVLLGVSRKSIVGGITGRPLGERLYGSVALAVYAVMKGVACVRVHDVGPTVEALMMIRAVLERESRAR